MKKFTLIQENYNLERFTITREQFITYRKTIESILLKDLYPEKSKHANGLTLLGPLNCEKGENRDFSIFGKINTNVMVMKYLVRTFKLNTFEDLLRLIEDRKRDFFIEGQPYFNEIWKLLKITESYGDQNEIVAVEYLKNVIKSKLNLDITPLRSPQGSYDDLINGIDIKFDINNKQFTCQVKPLVNINESGEDYIITSSGNIKTYHTDYLAFSNGKTGETALFKNKQVTLNGNTIIIPKKHRVVA